jgi:hypothetical protein
MPLPHCLRETTKDASYKLFHSDAQHKDRQKKREIALSAYSLTKANFFVCASSSFCSTVHKKIRRRVHRIAVLGFCYFVFLS